MRNQTALFIIKMSCGEEMSLHMEGEEDAANAWRRLKNVLEDDEAASAERIKGSVAAASNSDSNGIMFDRHELLTVKYKAFSFHDGVNNYESWVFCMKNYLIIQGLWGFVEEDHIIDHVKDEKALDVIKDSCAPETLDYILYMDCAKNAWKELARVGGIDVNTAFFRGDIVWDLLSHFPSDYVLGKDAYGMTLLSVLAENPSAFPSGNQFGYFGGWIYQLAESKTHETLLEALKLIVFPVESLVEPVDPPAEPVDPDLVALPVRRPLRFLKHHCKAGSKAHKTLLKALKLTGVKEVLDCKVKHDLVDHIIHDICSLLPNLLNPHQLEELSIYDAMHRSINNGIIELFENLIYTNPYLEDYKDENGRGWFQIAIMARQESIFQHIYGMWPRNQGKTLLDKFGNNALHCAALWNPTPQLDKVHGPALQEQRELQWFQEVERIVPPRYALMKNNKKNGTANDETHKTPGELFTLQHKGLAKEGEKWMKDTAQACMLVTTLIATVMFAAAFTLPGGSDQNTGVPLKANTTAFKVFIISDAISLFSSCTSVLMFFAILTSRYAERDFLTSLPKKMILGLSTLFISIATMMATFAATLVIVLRGQASWAYIPVTILASIPVGLFGLLQLPLFINILKSTYGRGIFHRKTRIVFAPLTSINVKY